MEPGKWRGIANSSVDRDVLIVSELRFLRDSLTDILTRLLQIRVCKQAATLADAIASVEIMRPELILLDVAFPGGAQTAVRLCAAVPEAEVIVLGVYETEANVLAWAEAGVAGYVPNTASVDDLVALIGQINRGELSCPPPIVGGMWRRIAAAGRQPGSVLTSQLSLTKHEAEVLNLLSAGLSNKDIARRLRISLITTKTHVHHLLGKLSLPRRTDVMARMRGGPFARHDGSSP